MTFSGHLLETLALESASAEVWPTIQDGAHPVASALLGDDRFLQNDHPDWWRSNTWTKSPGLTCIMLGPVGSKAQVALTIAEAVAVAPADDGDTTFGSEAEVGATASASDCAVSAC